MCYDLKLMQESRINPAAKRDYNMHTCRFKHEGDAPSGSTRSPGQRSRSRVPLSQHRMETCSDRPWSSSSYGQFSLAKLSSAVPMKRHRRLALARSRLALTEACHAQLAPTVATITLTENCDRQTVRFSPGKRINEYRDMSYPPPAPKVNKENPLSASRRPLFLLKPAATQCACATSPTSG